MSDTEETTDSAQAIKAAERIRELNRINEEFPTLLRTASTAISFLTSNPKTQSPHSPSDSPTDTDSPSNLSLDIRKERFQRTAESYLTHLKSLTDRLKEEANALVDAGIIPATPPRGGGPGSEEGITNAGLGGLDIGVLNARVGDPGKGWEAEVVGHARELVGERVLKEKVGRDAENGAG